MVDAVSSNSRAGGFSSLRTKGLLLVSLLRNMTLGIEEWDGWAKVFDAPWNVSRKLGSGQ